MPPIYIHQVAGWPDFKWNPGRIANVLSHVRHKQGTLKGYVAFLGFSQREESTLHTLSQDVLKSSEIEGEVLNADQVRSSIARKLGIDIGGPIKADRHVEGVVEMILDATLRYTEPLTAERLFSWHEALFPTGKSGMHKIEVGSWRSPEGGPMQVVSGAMGKEKVHFEAPPAKNLDKEMAGFLQWFNHDHSLDPVLKAAIAHFWFVTIHPFDDGNGRIARAIADLQLARADNDAQRFYSMSAQIREERSAYYDILEKTQKGDLDITEWLEWFLHCLDKSLDTTHGVFKRVLNKAQFWDEHRHTSVNERQRLLINKLFDGFEGKLTSSKWAKLAKCSQDTALRDISDLLGKGILQKEAAGGRSTGYFLAERFDK